MVTMVGQCPSNEGINLFWLIAKGQKLTATNPNIAICGAEFYNYFWATFWGVS